MARSSPREHIPLGGMSRNHFVTRHGSGYRARGRYRDFSGVLREASGSGPTADAAVERMRQNAQRALNQGGIVLTSDSRVSELADAWLEERSTSGTLKPQSLEQYRSAVDQHIRPALGQVRIGDVTVPLLDRVISGYVKRGSPATASRLKKVLSGMFGVAVRVGLVPHNPVASVVRVASNRGKPVSLEPDAARAVRKALRQFRTGTGFNGPRADGQLAQFVEVMLGTSARPGEVLALRLRDLDLAGPQPRVYINGTIVEDKVNGGLMRQATTKYESQARWVPLPQYAVRALRERLAVAGPLGPDDLVFTTRSGRPHSVSNMGARWRRFREAHPHLAGVDLEKMTPYVFRKTVATTLARQVDLELARDMLGHSTIATTEQFYEGRQKSVNPVAAAVLDSVLGDIDEELEALTANPADTTLSLPEGL